MNFPPKSLLLSLLLWKGLEDGVDLLGDGHEAELELAPRLHHAAPALVADVLQRGRDVDLLAALDGRKTSCYYLL